jgi:hypothetical protein
LIEFYIDDISAVLRATVFEISATLRQLGWIDAPHTQNFEILKSLEQTQESKKKIKSVLKFCGNGRHAVSILVKDVF